MTHSESQRVIAAGRKERLQEEFTFVDEVRGEADFDLTSGKIIQEKVPSINTPGV